MKQDMKTFALYLNKYKTGADIIYKSSYKATLELNKVVGFLGLQPDEHLKYQRN